MVKSVSNCLFLAHKTGFLVGFGFVWPALKTFFNSGSSTAAEQTPPYEKPPIKLNAALIVPDGKMEGKGYKIDPRALNDGDSNNYTLKTEVGNVDAVSDYQLARQIQEIRALQILDEMSRAGCFYRRHHGRRGHNETYRRHNGRR